MATLETRIATLETSHSSKRSVHSYSDKELEAYLLPFFGGVVPTTEQLIGFLKDQTVIPQENENAKS